MTPKILYYHILLAEDDNDDFEFFKDALKDYPEIELSRAYDGEVLMKMLKEGRIKPQIIYLDINMPRKNGMQCLKEIRSTPSLKKLPVVIMSTTRNDTIIGTFFEAGANCYICKPNVFSELKNLIQKTLSIDWDKPNGYSKRENFVLG
jgi:DNA-binding response OmpR family regulator